MSARPKGKTMPYRHYEVLVTRTRGGEITSEGAVMVRALSEIDAIEKLTKGRPNLRAEVLGDWEDE